MSTEPGAAQFAKSLRAYLVAQTTESWMFWYGLLEIFVKEREHCRVSASHKTDDGYRLGQWVGVQKTNKDIMDPDRRQRLEAMAGWSWNFLSDKWEQGFAHLKEFSDREGHCRVPVRFTTYEGNSLGNWVGKQRNRKKIDPDRRKRLEALPGWVWKIEK